MFYYDLMNQVLQSEFNNCTVKLNVKRYIKALETKFVPNSRHTVRR